MTDLVERLRVNAKSWRRKDAFMARDQEEEARFNDEAADRIERLQRELAEARFALEKMAGHEWQDDENRRSGGVDISLRRELRARQDIAAVALRAKAEETQG